MFGSYADAIISAGMAKNIIRENDYEKDTYRSYSYNYLLYGSCLYMKAGKTEKIYRALRNLGICILTEGIWVVTDSQILLLVTQHTSIIEQISFLSFFTLPFPLLEFLKEIMPGKHRMLSVMRKLFVFNLVLYLLN